MTTSSINYYFTLHERTQSPLLTHEIVVVSRETYSRERERVRARCGREQRQPESKRLRDKQRGEGGHCFASNMAAIFFALPFAGTALLSRCRTFSICPSFFRKALSVLLLPLLVRMMLDETEGLSRSFRSFSLFSRSFRSFSRSFSRSFARSFSLLSRSFSFFSFSFSFRSLSFFSFSLSFSLCVCLIPGAEEDGVVELLSKLALRREMLGDGCDGATETHRNARSEQDLPSYAEKARTQETTHQKHLKLQRRRTCKKTERTRSWLVRLPPWFRLS